MAPIARRKWFAVIGGFIAYACVRPGYAGSGSSDPKRFAIAGPVSDNATSEGASWHQIANDIASDLVASGRFAQIESELSREIPSIDVVPDFKKWRSTRAEWLIVCRVVTKPDRRLVVTFRLWDVANGQQVLGQQYLISQDDLQRISHILAQAITEHLNGEHDRLEGETKK
jgi:Tol biopolymer transport system component